jgi:hypothetical protein
MNSKMREQTNMKRYEYLRTPPLQFEDPGVRVGTHLGKVAKRNWMKTISFYCHKNNLFSCCLI